MTFASQFCRAAEYEADAIGVRLLAKACYDPDANITMLQKLNAVTAKQEARMPEILSTHPITQVWYFGVPDTFQMLCDSAAADQLHEYLNLTFSWWHPVSTYMQVVMKAQTHTDSVSITPVEARLTAVAVCMQERVVRVRQLLPEAYALHQENCSMMQGILGRFASLVSEVDPMARVLP